MFCLTGCVRQIPIIEAEENLATQVLQVISSTTLPEAATPTQIIEVSQGLPPARFTPSPVVKLTQPENFSIKYSVSAMRENFAFPDDPCQWAGVGGQVLDHAGQGMAGIYVFLKGELPQGQFQAVAVSGSAVEFGTGGFRLQLAERPIQVDGNIGLQLLDNDGKPLSPIARIFLEADCQSNLAWVEFSVADGPTSVHLPLIQSGLEFIK